uniref:Uncharacterized protein n=1 Tax=mine drainage metagenome TaxID=410659 RepID=E6PW39_9ZZZZ
MRVQHCRHRGRRLRYRRHCMQHRSFLSHVKTQGRPEFSHPLLGGESACGQLGRSQPELRP